MFLCRFFFFCFLTSSILLAQSTRIFQDIYGKSVTLPESITHIYGSAPAIDYMIGIIDDSSLVGVSFPQRSPDNKDADKFFSERFMRLPLLGGWHGHGVPSIDAILAKKPQVIITWDTPYYNETIAKEFSHSSIPVLKMNFDNTNNYPKAFRFMGKILHKEKRSDALAKMAENYLSELNTFVKSIRFQKFRILTKYFNGCR